MHAARLLIAPFVACIVLPSGGCATGAKTAARSCAAIRSTLADQAAAWNRGDIDAYMHAYWDSAELTFSSGGRTRRGFAATRDGYKAHYPTPAQMGQLTFAELEIRPLGDRAALVLGRWHLARRPDPVGGNFTLVLQRLDGRWRIIHDHTSVTPPAATSAPAE